MARPKKDIDPVEVEKLASINCSVEEISNFFEVHKRTIERRFAAALKRGRSHGRMSLKRRMWESAMSNNKGSIVMQIWLSKNILGYSDKVEQQIEAKEKNRVIQIQWADEDEQSTSDAKSENEEKNTSSNSDKQI